MEVLDTDYRDAVKWEFTVAEQGFVARYGKSANFYYRQVLPGGIEMPDRYPPRRISKWTYDLAAGVHARIQEKKSPE